jgi:hypothetical protein
MVRVAVGDEDQINILRGKAELEEAEADRMEKMGMARIDEDCFRSPKEVGIAIVGRRVLPKKGVKVIGDFHTQVPSGKEFQLFF